MKPSTNNLLRQCPLPNEGLHESHVNFTNLKQKPRIPECLQVGWPNFQPFKCPSLLKDSLSQTLTPCRRAACQKYLISKKVKDKNVAKRTRRSRVLPTSSQKLEVESWNEQVMKMEILRILRFITNYQLEDHCSSFHQCLTALLAATCCGRKFSKIKKINWEMGKIPRHSAGVVHAARIVGYTCAMQNREVANFKSFTRLITTSRKAAPVRLIGVIGLINIWNPRSSP